MRRSPSLDGSAMSLPFYRLNRRAFLGQCGLGLGSAALASLVDGEARGGPHHEPRARHIIYMHMIGAPSQLDLLDPKPALLKYDGQPCPEDLIRGKRFAFIGGKTTFAASHYKFSRHGNSGQSVSELLPHFAKIVDD